MIHLIQLILLHYLVKVETPKMHVDTTSAFNFNHKIAVTCIKLHWQFHKMKFMCSKCPPLACTHDLRQSRHWSITASFSLFWVSHRSVATLIRWGEWSSYVSFIMKSNSENCVKIHCFFTKLQTKISWLIFYGSQCVSLFCCVFVMNFIFVTQQLIRPVLDL